MQCGAKDTLSGERCSVDGEPAEGYDFFVCDMHLEELQHWLEFYSETPSSNN